MAKTKLSTAEVRAILQAEKSDALSGMESSELSSQRSKAMEYYLGSETLDGDMPPPPDRSTTRCAKPRATLRRRRNHQTV